MRSLAYFMVIALWTMKCVKSYQKFPIKAVRWIDGHKVRRIQVRSSSSGAFSLGVATPPTLDLSYKLLDHGDFQRLEKFGQYTVIRPSKTSRFKRLVPDKWRTADFTHSIDTTRNTSQWENIVGRNFDNWMVQFGHMKFKLSAFDGGQVGIFPEQAKQWKWLGKTLQQHLTNQNERSGSTSNKTINILNGFAYTGGSTLACLVHPNVLVTNLDASKSSTIAAKENIAISDIQGNVRWIIDDCQTFVNREIRRIQDNSSNAYDGLIFDPPAFGRSKDKKKNWQINRDLPVLIDSIPRLLSKNPAFVLITSHDPSWSEDKLGPTLFNVMKNAGYHGYLEKGRLGMYSKDIRGKKSWLDLGSYARWSRYPSESDEEE